MNKKIGILVFSLLFIFSLFTPFVRADMAPSLDEGLVLYLPFDEGSGVVAIDQSGFNNHAVLVASETWQPGKYGSCLNFSDGYGVVTSNSELQLKTNFTISFWYYPQNIAEAWVQPSAKTGSFIFSHGDSNNIYFGIYNETNLDADYFDGTFTNNNWYLLTVVINGTHKILCKDGLPSVTSYNLDVDLNTNSVVIGDITGMIDDYRIYNRVLSQSEITFLYENPQPTPTPAPSATPIPQDMATSAIMSTIILVILVITNIVFLGVVHSAMVRFLFALLTLMIGIASLTVQDVTFNPYLQMVTVVMSLLCMLLAAKAKG